MSRVPRPARPLRLTLTVVLLVVVALLAGGCRKVVSDELLEGMVVDYFQQVSDITVEADCPKGRTMATDNNFFCETRFYGRTGYLLVVQRDRWGRIEFRNENPLDHEEQERGVAAFLADEYDIRDAKVSCPRLVVPLDGENFTCRAGSRRVRVTQVKANYEFNYHLVGSNPGGAT